MAVKPEELEFWLPSEFLTDEDILMDSNFRGSDSVSSQLRFQIPGSQLCNGTTLSSPVESVVGSTETGESIDEDVSLLSELTRQLTLLDAHRFAPTRPTHEKKWVQSGSPQSTLLHVESFSGRSTGSSNGSPNGPSQVSSPPTTPLSRNNNSWDLIYGAAGVVDGLKSNTAGGLTSSNTSGIFERQGSFSKLLPPKSSVHPSICPNYLVQGEELFRPEGCGLRGGHGQLINGPNTITGHNMGGGWVRNSSVLACGCRGIQFGNKNHLQLGSGGARGCGFQLGAVGYGVGHGPGCGSVTRVPGRVGVEGQGLVKSERVGTGVFLPRRYDEKSSTTSPFNTVDSRKKSGYSSGWTAKKAPVINKNITNKNVLTRCSPEKIVREPITDYNAALLARKVPISLPLQKSAPFPEPAFNLPQEWTY